MSEVRKYFGSRLAALTAVAVLACGVTAGSGFAAEYEVRMPVEKTVRISPLGDVQDQDVAKPAPAKSVAAKPSGDTPEKAVPGKTAPAAASNATSQPERKGVTPSTKNGAAPAKPVKPAAKRKEKREPVASVDAGSDTAPGAAKAPAPKSTPSTSALAKPAPPKPEPPKLDPKASVMPAAATAAGSAAPLPADGQWVGDLNATFEEQGISLHAATNAAVSHVTWFNQAEPRKLAIDLHGEWRKKGDHVLRFDTGPVKNIIVGEHPDRLRLAVEFRDGAVLPAVEPKITTGPDGVFITIPLAVRLAR
ncbi:MAG: AMIN domain-containing protein [Humidesulfovibrio sp.]|nr:AMIN domain-containing protein [Humidesulfovibrio sp.]